METRGLLWDGVVFGKTLLVRGQAQRLSYASHFSILLNYRLNNYHSV